MKYHRNIPYEYNEWTTWNGKQASGYSCDYFNFHPYHIMYFPTTTEEEMHERIDDYLDNRATYEYKRKLSDASAADYYTDTTRYQGD